MSIHRITYFSSAVSLLDEAALTELLAQSRDLNERDGVTGLLMYHLGNFLQLLEGPRPAVEETMGRILRDARHRRIIIVENREVAERVYPEWSMAFVTADGRGTQVRAFQDLRLVAAGRAPPMNSPTIPVFVESYLKVMPDLQSPID